VKQQSSFWERMMIVIAVFVLLGCLFFTVVTQPIWGQYIPTPQPSVAENLISTTVPQVVETAVADSGPVALAASETQQNLAAGDIEQAPGGGCVANCNETTVIQEVQPTETPVPTDTPVPTNTPEPTATPLTYSTVYGQVLRQDYGLFNSLKGVEATYKVVFNGQTFLSGTTDKDGFFDLSAPQYSQMFFCHPGNYGLQVPLDASVGNPDSPATFPLFNDNLISCVP